MKTTLMRKVGLAVIGVSTSCASAAPDEDTLAPDVPAAFPFEEEASTDKILDGAASSEPGVVYIARNNGLHYCSGTLIGANWLLTAAHCFEREGAHYQNQPDGFTVKTSNGTVISSIAHIVFRYPSYNPTTFAKDLALVWSASGWAAPANTSSSWKRIMGKAVGTGGAIKIYGYGVTTNLGNIGGGVLRRSLLTTTIDSSTTDWIGIRSTQGEGTSCKGDSGGPALNLGSPFSIVVGVSSNFDETEGYYCSTYGNTFRYVQAGGGLTGIAGFDVRCSTGTRELATEHSCWIKDTISNYTGGATQCTRFSASDATWGSYNYLRCF